MLIQTLRSRWFAALVHAGLWLLFGLAVAALGGRAPRYIEVVTVSAAYPDPIPVVRIRGLFGPPAPLTSLEATNLVDPFFTKHFMPPVLPPPTTRKVQLTYHGFFETADGPKVALVQVGDAMVPATLGAKAVANLLVADITWQALKLTNSAAQAYALPLNGTTEVEVPIQ